MWLGVFWKIRPTWLPRNPRSRQAPGLPFCTFLCLSGGPREVLALLIGNRPVGKNGKWRCPLRPSPVHRTHHPVTLTQTGMGAAISPHFYPMITSAWQSSPCCVASGPWASLPSVWLRSVRVWDWEGTGTVTNVPTNKNTQSKKSHA